jgi:hypothetical protein
MRLQYYNRLTYLEDAEELRILYRKVCGFDSRLSHSVVIPHEADLFSVRLR